MPVENLGIVNVRIRMFELAFPPPSSRGAAMGSRVLRGERRPIHVLPLLCHEFVTVALDRLNKVECDA